MHSEAKIYLGLTVVGGVATAYLLDKLVVLLQRAFAPIDVAVFALAVIALLALSVFYAVLTFVFSRRFIDHVGNENQSVVLYRPNGTAVQVNGDLRVIRRFRKQFSSNENQQDFVLFIADGQLWVRRQEQAQNGV